MKGPRVTTPTDQLHHLLNLSIIWFHSKSFSFAELPSQPVDMVIDALTNHDNNDIKYNWLSCVIEWANHNKAPVLALDPCIRSSKPGNVFGSITQTFHSYSLYVHDVLHRMQYFSEDA